jgi:hypothetical protein
MRREGHRPLKLSIHDRANIFKREGGKISKNQAIVENNRRIQGIMTKLTRNLRSEPSKVINVISMSRIFLGDVS